MIGWIKLHRKFIEWGWYQDSNMVHLFIHLLLSANRKPGNVLGTNLERGQTIIGRKKLSEQTGISEQTLRTCITRLKSTKEITTKSTNRFTIVTICNYDIYQPPDSETNQQINQDSNQQLTSNQPATNHKQEVKKKEERKENSLSDPPGSNGESISKNKKDSKIYRETQECLPLARTLARIVQSQKNIDISSQKKLSWANDIRKLVFTSEKVSYERVSDALRWYRKNVGGEYVPVIESGSSLRTKFIKLENAIARDNGSAKNSSPGSRYRNKTKLDMNKKTKTLN